ncbi:hypothetical protein C8R45DRAFT_1106363 [Mycena sanguinolenta]|nr:hypothetical protein C8R45DRAFT_1106363 [Mycena sanguinolenta]
MSLAELEADLHYEDQAFIACVEALRPSEVTAIYPNPSYLPCPVATSKHFARTIYKWEPHPFTPQERDAVQLEGLRYLAIAQRIETVQRDIHPRMLPEEVEAQLKFVRQSYMLRCCRLFRINDLPTEIITSILRFAIRQFGSRPRSIDAQLRVTWTCRRWRELALADSTLWNIVVFWQGHPIEREWAWFERARQTPLEIHLDFVYYSKYSSDGPEDSMALDMPTDPSTNAEMLRQILLRLFAKLPTIRTLVLAVGDWKNPLVALELFNVFARSSGVPMLHGLSLHLGGFYGLEADGKRSLPWSEMTPHQFLGGVIAPSLVHLTLDGMPIDWSSSVIGNLTTLELRNLPESHSPDATRFRDILMNCPGLHKLLMKGAGPRFDERSSKPVTLPHLRSLTVSDLSCQKAMFLFSQILAPNVNDLVLMHFCDDDYLPVFIQITSSFPEVRSLTMYSIDFDYNLVTAEAMIRWLDSMPLLAYLKVADVPNPFFGLFFRPGDNVKTPVSPRLTFLDCQCLDHPGILTQWAKDRQQFGTPLEKIYISEELSSRLDSTQINTLMQLCVLAEHSPGLTTAEEQGLLF